ncbi:MAG: DEAD/DEAH box helicase [Acidobacteria bacterium]|nr:DEAD/DEAH box helicase [Acidobacteriota bacterium]
MKFYDLGLTDALARRCESLNFTEPTPIQKRAIPVILKGADLIGCAETGTGKTAAFLLPALQKMIRENKPGVRVLVIAPTRELVSQIEEAYRQLAPSKYACVSLIGGASVKNQCTALKRGVSLIIATPGRLIDHLQRGTVDLTHLDTLVLDEADRMLDMGFLPAVKQILAKVPASRQTLLFSATMSSPVRSLAYSIMKNPEEVEVSRRQNVTAETIEQLVYPVAQESKTALLLNLLETNNFERVIVFTRTKRSAENLAHILTKREMKANRIHADRSQSQRETALRDLKQGKISVLVATDIASRGIDVDAVSHVINYDVPEAPENYVHRVGRTGRAGNQGQAITLVAPGDELAMRGIERLTEQQVKRVVLPDFGGREPAAGGFSSPAAGGFIKAKSFRSFRPRRSRR